MRITSIDPAADSRTFTVNREIAANFCNTRCPRGISEIMTGSFPRSRLLARNNFQTFRIHAIEEIPRIAIIFRP